MIESNLILNGLYTPSYDEITEYINEPARVLWTEMNEFLLQRYKSSVKIAYSKCSGKPGWNIKHQKSGKSLCTLYPEKDSFTSLVVITLGLVPVIEAMADNLEPCIIELINKGSPFNGTLWLMICVDNAAVLDSVKQLIILKQGK